MNTLKNTRNPYKELKGKLNVSGININKFRNKIGMSAQELSDKLMILGLDIHRQAIYAIETGVRTVSDYELCVIADVLGVTTDELLKPFADTIKKNKK